MGERREQRRIEKTAGTGSVSHAGIVLGSVPYVMEIWQTVHIVKGIGQGPEEEVPGMKELRIQFLRRGLDALRLPEQGATLVLQLEDGRRVDGFMNGGSFIPSSQLTAA